MRCDSPHCDEEATHLPFVGCLLQYCFACAADVIERRKKIIAEHGVRRP